MLTLVIIVAVLIAVLLVLAATRPDTFRLQRSTSIMAPPEKVYALIEDFHRWPAWSPWEKMDPALKRTHSGAASGKGAVYEWEGNKKVGKGRMEITAASPASSVTIKLDFFKPFEAHNTAEFTLEPRGGAATAGGGPTTAAGGPTKVTWAMHGPQPFMAKLMSVFFSMDKMVGKDFEAGLANMKAAAEK